MLGALWTIRKFKYELKERKFKSQTDHKALIEMGSNLKFKNVKITRWVEKVQEYDFTVEYIQGETMGVADELSTIQDDDAENEREEDPSKGCRGKNNKKSIIFKYEI